ncbi:hypothetical protein Q9251_11025 [Alkalihalobacillus macyae]|uniref:hypothetical protein n=1 Tax=Guptibacillus hwajinpoensis TaxID=208199 RepID=UPI00273CEFA4|nr:hypothetical protein [Alkalihalobacillus macyae]MDP4551413.1 hypothetical protein [Alkalihalobacillus macyae]
MKERVGECANCHKPIYCLDGFLDGVISENRALYCFSCKDLADNVTVNNDSKEYGS